MMVCGLEVIMEFGNPTVACLQFGSGDMGNKRSNGVVSLFPVVQVSKDDSVVLGLGRDE
jgi:hypothetical protein